MDSGHDRVHCRGLRNHGILALVLHPFSFHFLTKGTVMEKKDPRFASVKEDLSIVKIFVLATAIFLIVLIVLISLGFKWSEGPYPF